MANRAVRIAISLILMGLLLAVFLWNVDLDEVGHALAQADPMWMVVATLLALLSYWLRALRWQLILRPVGRVAHSSVVLTTAVGYAAMTLLPARMGDIIRPVLLARRERIPTSASLASILTERVFDLWTVVVYFLVFVIWPPQMEHLDDTATSYLAILGRTGYIVGAGVVLGTLILLGLFRFQGRFVDGLTRPLGRLGEKPQQAVANFLNHFLDGLRILQRPRDLLVTVVTSALLWYVIYWQVKVTLVAFDLDLPLRVAFLIVTLAVIGLAIPTPGGVGGFHKATQVGLTVFFGVELNKATGIAIAYHAICFLPITVIGVLCLPLLGLTVKGTLATGKEVES